MLYICYIYYVYINATEDVIYIIVLLVRIRFVTVTIRSCGCGINVDGVALREVARLMGAHPTFIALKKILYCISDTGVPI